MNEKLQEKYEERQREIAMKKIIKESFNSINDISE